MLKGSLCFRAVSIILAVILALTAGLKLHMLLTDPFVDIKTGYPDYFIWSGAMAEIIVVIIVISRAKDITKLTVLSSLLAVFTAVSSYNIAHGNSNCGCAGSIDIHPTWFLAFDLLGLFALSRTYLMQARESFVTLRSGVPDSISGFATGAAVIFCLFCFLRMSSVKNFYQWSLGELAVTSQIDRRVEGDTATKTRVLLANSSSEAINIISVNRSCSCVSVEGHEELIPPLGNIAVEITVDKTKSPNLGRYKQILNANQRVIFYLDSSVQRALQVNLF